MRFLALPRDERREGFRTSTAERCIVQVILKHFAWQSETGKHCTERPCPYLSCTSGEAGTMQALDHQRNRFL